MTARLTALVLFALFAFGCGAPPPAPKLEVPWQDGETTIYDVLDKDERPTGVSTWTISKRGDGGWTLSEERTGPSRHDKNTTEIDAALAPIDVQSGSARAHFTKGGVEIETTEKGQKKTTHLPLPAAPIENDVTVQMHRAMALAPGFSARYDDVITKAAKVAPIDVEVVGRETIVVPAGSFETFHVRLKSGNGPPQDAFYDVERPHLLVRYENRPAHSAFRLRAYRTAADAELRGVAEAPPLPPEEPLRINFALLAISALVSWPLMIGTPILLAILVRRRLGPTWKVFWLGALAFVLSQVVHVPLNWALGVLGTPARLGLLPAVPFAILVGLSAGLCEEIARYLMMRFALKSQRSWADAVMFGAGHGGIEAILVGALAAINLIAIAALIVVPMNRLGIEGETATQVTTAARKVMSGSLDTPILAGVERLAAVAVHVGLSVLVMRAVARRRVGYLLLAIALHAALDGGAVWMMGRGISSYAIEAFAIAFAALVTVLSFALRDRSAPGAGT